MSVINFAYRQFCSFLCDKLTSASSNFLVSLEIEAFIIRLAYMF